MGRFRDRFAEGLRANARPWEVAVFAWIPAIAVSFAYWYEAHASQPLQDFGIFRAAAKLVLHGRSPFPPADVQSFAHFDKFVYPPSTALLFAPLAELPLGVARVVMLLLGVLCVFAALRLLDVRDWRCYGISAMSAPAINSLALGAVTSFLLVGVAAVWRYRSSPTLSGTTAALTAVVKVFLWPLGIWLLVTRRLRAAAVAACVAAAVTLGGWAVIGFAGLGSYPKLLHALSQAEQGTSYSPVAFLGLSGTPAVVLPAALVCLVVAATALAARGADGDRRAFTVAVIGALVATPILWLHYFLLLLVPIALYRPRISGLWILPLLLWATPTTHSHGSTWRIGLSLAVVVVIALRTLGEQRTSWLVPPVGRLRPNALRRVGHPVGAE